MLSWESLSTEPLFRWLWSRMQRPQQVLWHDRRQETKSRHWEEWDVAFPAFPAAEVCICDPDFPMWGWDLEIMETKTHVCAVTTLGTVRPSISRTGGEHPGLGVGQISWSSGGSRKMTSQRCPCPSSQHLNMCFTGTQSWADVTQLRIWGLRGSIELSGWDWRNGGEGQKADGQRTWCYSYIIMEEEGKKEMRWRQRETGETCWGWAHYVTGYEGERSKGACSC